MGELMTTVSELTKLMLRDPLEPGSAEWYKVISASKVAAIMGLSPYKSAFALWHEMAGTIEPDEGNKATERGKYLEPAVLAWFVDQHPEIDVYRAHGFRHPEREDWTAAPDAVGSRDGEAIAVEVKTDQDKIDWGEPLTAQVPPGYLCQGTFQMMVTGIREVRVPVLFGSPSFEFAEYVVKWDDVAEDVPLIIERVEAFQRSLAAREQPPLDGSQFTYQALRKLHPQIDPRPIDLPHELAVGFLKAHEKAVASALEEAFWKNEIADFMGEAKWAKYANKTIFTRMAKGEGTPYLTIGKSLPTDEDIQKYREEED
jgi:putative phage-type endonuclease